MIPQAGSAYAYSYATLGELVAWIIGWDLILEYAVGNIAVAIAWSGYFNSLLSGFGIDLPDWLTHGYRTALLSSDPAVHALLQTAPRIAGIPILLNIPAFVDRHAHHLAALHRRARRARARTTSWSWSSCSCSACSSCSAAMHIDPANYVPFAPNGWRGHPSGRGDRVLRLHRLRRDLDGGGGDEEPAAQHADRHPRRAGHLHADLRHRRHRRDRAGAVSAAARRPIRWRRRSKSPGCRRRAGSSSFGAVVSLTAVLLVFQYGQPRIFFAMARDGLLPAWAREDPPEVPHAAHHDRGHRHRRRARQPRAGRERDLRPHQHRHAVRRSRSSASACWCCATRIPIARGRSGCRSSGRSRCVGRRGVPVHDDRAAAHAWERFGIWLAVGLLLYFVYGYQHSRLRRGRSAAERPIG